MKSTKFVAVLLLQAALMGTPSPQSGPSLDTARQLFLGGKLKEAAEMYAILTVTQPKLEEAHVRLIRTRIAGNDLAGATQAARQALSELPISASVWAAAGDLQFRFSKFTQASSIYNQALQLDPKSARALLGLGRVNQLASMNKSARNYFVKAYQLDPNDPQIALARAKTLDVPADVATALEQYLSLADFRKPDDIDSYRRQITEYRYLGQRNDCRISGLPTAVTIPIRELSLVDLIGVKELSGIGPTTAGIPVSVNTSKARTFQLLAKTRGITVTASYAKELKLPRIVDGPSGGSKYYRAFAEKIRIANIELNNCVVTVLDWPDFNGADGQIGLPLLSDFLITLNLKKNYLRLEPEGALPTGTNPDFQDAVVGNDKKDFTRVFRYGAGLLISTRVNTGEETLFGISLETPFTLVSSSLPGNSLSGVSPIELNFDFSTCTKNCVVLKFDRFAVRTTAIPINTDQTNYFAGIEMGGELGYNAIKGSSLTIDYRNGLVEFER